MTPLDYEFLRRLLKERSGLDLSSDKQYLVESRLIPLARRVGLPGIGELVQKLKGGAEPLTLPTGEMRRFLEDGDEVSFSATATAPGARAIGFGDCRAAVLAAL